MYLKKRIHILIIMIFSFPFLSSGQSNVELIDRDWRFNLGDFTNAESSTLNDSNWRQIDLPHDWSIEQPLNPELASATGYLPGGIGWYRKSFIFHKKNDGEKTLLYFDGIYNNSEVFVNGKSVGQRPNGYISFYYDISPFLVSGKVNYIAVKVDHSKYNDSRWYTGSGIYRHVYLYHLNPVHIDVWGLSYTTIFGNNNQVHLNTTTKVVNDLNIDKNVTIVQELLDPLTNKIIKSGKKEIKFEKSESENVNINLKDFYPKLWNISSPNLYKLKTSIYVNKKVVDVKISNIGFRKIHFDPNTGFSLNDKNIKLKGVCIHHDAGVLGAAVPKEVWKRRLLTLKDIGCNAIRLSHNPQSPEFYDLCDELGFVVMDESFDEWRMPKRKWVKGWNIGEPTYDGYSSYFDKWGERDLKDMVSRDKLHPSIIMWSIGNEVDYPNDPYSHPILDSAKIGQKVFGGYQPDRPNAAELGVIAKRLVASVKEVDTTRPVTAALAGVVMSNFTDYPNSLDIAGYNYTEDRYVIDHKTYPKRIIYGSENRHDIDAWKTVRDNKNIFGQFLWTGIDYLGESGEWPSRGFYSGLVDLAGYLKPRGAFRKALWSDLPYIYIGSYKKNPTSSKLSIDAWPLWNYNDGDTIRVVAYMNTPFARLNLNGKIIDAIKSYDDNTGIVYWDLPYEAGTLYVEGLDKNRQKITSQKIETFGIASNIIANPIEKNINKENGIAQIEISIVDKNGILVQHANDSLIFEIIGPGKLLGLEAGNNSDMGNYRDNIQQAFNGKMIAYINAIDAGEIKIKISSKILPENNVTIITK